MAEEQLYFTPEEISVIDKHLGFIVFDWPKRLVGHVIHMASQKGVDNVYINSVDTLDSGSNDDKANYFYETLPERMGFKKVQVNLRGKGAEPMWVMALNKSAAAAQVYEFVKLAQTERTFTFEQIPKEHQGAVINMLGKRPVYKRDELLRVLTILESKKQKEKEKQKQKISSKFYYDWKSASWTGSQRFRNDITETVVKQKLPIEVQNFIGGNPTLRKFWGFILGQSNHFGPDVIGFALISRVNDKSWVINEIQTDCINFYLDIRSKYYKNSKREDKEDVSWETIRDMLQAQNRSNWIAKCEAMPELKGQLLRNPNMINQLPDNSVDPDKWLAEQRAAVQNAGGGAGIDLMRAIQATNFNKRVFKAG